MADVTPNYALERKKIEVQISQLRHNMNAGELRIMQLENDMEVARTGIEATAKAIADQETLLASLTPKETE